MLLFLFHTQGHQVSERVSLPGAAAGLVWTSVGGLVQYIECCRVGAGQLERLGSLKLTGQVCRFGNANLFEPLFDASVPPPPPNGLLIQCRADDKRNKVKVAKLGNYEMSLHTERHTSKQGAAWHSSFQTTGTPNWGVWGKGFVCSLSPTHPGVCPLPVPIVQLTSLWSIAAWGKTGELA